MRILFAAGGTAGHINPAIAVAQYFSEYDTSSECLFAAVPGGMEEELVRKAGYQTAAIRVQGLKRSISLENIKCVAKIPRALKRADQIIEDFSPDAVFATGGYLSFPIVWTASAHNIPCFLHESNAIAGLSIKLLSRRADAVLLNYMSAADTLSKRCHIYHVGNPLRSSFKLQGYAHARRALGISDERFTVLSFGGSLGAERINNACLTAAGSLKHEIPHLLWHHVTGKDKYPAVVDTAAQHGVNGGILLHPYLDNMATYMAAADMVICRAGAVTLTELSALGKAAVLIPYPKATGNHQSHNAFTLTNKDAALLIDDNELSSEALQNAIITLWKNRKRRKELEENIRNLYVPNACEKIAEIMFKNL